MTGCERATLLSPRVRLRRAVGRAVARLFEEFALDSWAEVLAVNLHGTFYACRAVLPVMRGQGSGHIINVASAAAFHAPPRVSADNASKAAVLALSETLSAELADSPIGLTVKLSTFDRSRLPELTLRSGEDRELTRRLAERSELDAAPVASAMLAAAGHDELYVMLPAQARILWAFKRHAPRTYQRLLSRVYRAIVRKLTSHPVSA